MNQIFNFSAGPSVLPVEVLHKAGEEMVNYHGYGLSVMEMSHRSKAYSDIQDEAEQLLRKLMNIPDNYYVLFLQGGASTQFAMVPLNLMNKNNTADYLITGNWASKAQQEAACYGEARIVASSKDKTYSYIPQTTKADFNPAADYVHICTNNTIYGTRIAPDNLPDIGALDLVADMSSNILSEVYDVNKFALVYAGAQKNMGPAGVTIVIIRDDLLGNAMEYTPTMLDYKTHADNGSMYNTPPCYNIYICKLVFEWLDKLGGVATIEEINKTKAQKLYDYIDNSDFYHGTAEKEYRSLMNVPFICENDELNAEFVKQATARGLQNLKGHRSVGGMRASIYNAMSMDGIDALISFMQGFAKRNS
ncbi:MAG: 3-phosphoserine/phosphohydroxythreonine transaminase [Clostridiaceae bacterium]|mgnify:CR=1 FL=1|nr:3-phosphoserine/phosphohydroxythreonine transaminase [Clostridiaceae bacterium]